MVRLKFAGALVLLLLCSPALFIPNQVLSESAHSATGGRVTLVNTSRTVKRDDWQKAMVVFRPEELYAGSRGPKKQWDLLYGGLAYNGDHDWLLINSDRSGWSRVRDLGEMEWSDDIEVPVVPILPCRTNESCGRIQFPPPASGKRIHDEDVNPHIAKPVVGHVYVVHRRRQRTAADPPGLEALLDYYVIVRVEELKPNESCTIRWKRVSAPKK